MAKFETAGPEAGAALVSQLRCKVCKDKTTGVVAWSLSNLMDPTERAQLDNAMMTAIKTLGGEMTVGTAPPGDLERKVQERVDALKRQIKDM